MNYQLGLLVTKADLVTLTASWVTKSATTGSFYTIKGHWLLSS